MVGSVAIEISFAEADPKRASIICSRFFIRVVGTNESERCPKT
jgi:hypothetical protein